MVLPFEQRFFGGLGLRSEYVGHPLVDRVAWPTRAEARARLGIAVGSRVLGIFPGSRSQEIRRLWQPFRGAAVRLLGEGRCDRIIVAGTPGGDYPDPGPLEILRGDPIAVFAAADAALAKSGTTTLEAALADVPMVVAYKVHPLTWLMFQRLRTVKWVSLVNLVAEREVVPEMLQDRADGGAAGRRAAAHCSIRTTHARWRSAKAWRWCRRRLGQPGATTRVVALADELLGA